MKTVKVKEGEATKVATPTMQVTIEPSKKQLGRPSNPDSARQRKLAERKNKAIAGEYIELGRPVVPGSKRQLQLAAKAAGATGTGKKGRPKMTEEAKEAARADREVRKQAAIEKAKQASETAGA